MLVNTQPKIVSAQFPAELAERLGELTQANDRSLSAEVRRTVAEHLDRENTEK